MIRSNSSADCDGAPLAYADSEVASPPQSIGREGSGTASLTDEPSPPIKWDDIKVKLMCSYGGRILPRPHDNQLRYVGGESRMMVVNRNVTFAELKSKLCKVFGANLVVKYQLPCEDLDSLISVTSDEDLENMMEEYDRLQSAGNRASLVRLRLFLFPLKLEGSQTSSIGEMMDQTRASDTMFVDILNSMPALPRVRSEASSILSETQEYLVQGNMIALEEWAAATSYGNSCPPPQAEQLPESMLPNFIPAVALFGSLLQNPGSGDISSAPVSPSPIKLMPFSTSPFSSAPSTIIWPALTKQAATDIDPSLAASQEGLGSDDAHGSVTEEKKHVDSLITLTSDKSILNSSLGAAEQLLLPSGLMDDDDLTHISSAKGSLDEADTESHSSNSDAGVSQAVAGSCLLKNVGIPALEGQPIFGEVALPEHKLTQNLKTLQVEEISPLSSRSPSGIPSTLPQIPSSATLQGHVSSVATTMHQVIPALPQTVARSSGDDKCIHHDHPVLEHMEVSKLGGECGYLPSLSHFLSPLVSSQEDSFVTPSTKLHGGDGLSVQVHGIGSPKDVVGGGPPAATPMVSTTVHQPVIHKMATPVSYYLYHQYMQQHSPEASSSATTYANWAPGNLLPMVSETPSPLMNEAVAPFSKAPVLSLAADIAAPLHSVTGVSQPQSPQSIAPASSGGVFQPPLPHIGRTIPPTLVPSTVASSMGEAVKKILPTVPSVTPTIVIASIGEGTKGIPSVLYQQVETAQVQRQVSEHYSHKVVSPSQYAAAHPSVPPASGLPLRFQAVGHPIRQVAEGIPVQQSPVVVMVSDKKGAMSASVCPSGIPDSQSGYYLVEQSNAAAQQTLLGGVPGYNIPSNIKGAGVSSPDIVPSVAANPFVDTFSLVPPDQDARGMPPTEQQTRYHMWD